MPLVSGMLYTDGRSPVIRSLPILARDLWPFG